MFYIRVPNGDRFPAGEQVPALVSAWIDCPHCGCTEQSSARSALPVEVVDLNVGELQRLSAECDRCEEKSATMYLRWDLVLH